ncbi:MAG: hypothetical protein ABH828_04920 [archaeon]
MAHIIVTGIPKIGKSEVIDKVIKYSSTEKILKHNTQSISLGNIFKDIAFDLYSTKPENVPSLDYLLKEAIGKSTVNETKSRLKDVKKEESILVDTPISMIDGERSILSRVRSPDDFILFDDVKSIDAIITLIDAPKIVQNKLKGTIYPTDKERLLFWMNIESELSISYGDSVTGKRKRAIEIINNYSDKKMDVNGYDSVRNIVMPRRNAEISILKMLYDYNIAGRLPVIGYLVGPISNAKINGTEKTDAEIQRKLDNETKIGEFSKEAQKYILAINPIVLADTEFTLVDRAHTIHRDINYFVARSDIIIGYYPEECDSPGTEEELRNATMMAKPTILIHPKTRAEEEGRKKMVFDFVPTIRFYHEDEFYAAIANPNVVDELYKKGQVRNPAQARRALEMLVVGSKPRYHMFNNLLENNELFEKFKINI